MILRISTKLSRPSASSGRSKADLLPSEAEALEFLLPLSADYPGIDRWFAGRVIPGLRSGSRMLLRVERDGELVGLGIAKRDHDERKICTVRVAPSHAGRGIGVRIFDKLLTWLDDDKPHLTINSSKLPMFERIFDYYGFSRTSSKTDLYLPRAIELGFNEKDQKADAPQKPTAPSWLSVD
ncbi:GNAT family N-acetyltransferase [Lichenicola cladoniae]|uniref:GNAT family N-acetyltransferase n=1 Tax=Lichenicola cladoniae TaxID=1484109 RepID=A0A6M8HVM2_9PROT|nr:GNAT family N-acetyltransferase [Acetobacteraceae bacterium]QKE92191.1 GNAT family N-acetyltransferase [Lichenicola cladoniae]